MGKRTNCRSAIHVMDLTAFVALVQTRVDMVAGGVLRCIIAMQQGQVNHGDSVPLAIMGLRTESSVKR